MMYDTILLVIYPRLTQICIPCCPLCTENPVHKKLLFAHIIPAKPLHNHDTVPVHFNHFYCTKICDKLRRDLSILTYMYLNGDEY